MPDYPEFAIIDGKHVTRWLLIDGNVMTGRLVRSSITMDAYTVLRPDGTTCHVPTDKCSPATEGDVLEAIGFFSRIGK